MKLYLFSFFALCTLATVSLFAGLTDEEMKNADKVYEYLQNLYQNQKEFKSTFNSLKYEQDMKNLQNELKCLEKEFSERDSNLEKYESELTKLKKNWDRETYKTFDNYNVEIEWLKHMVTLYSRKIKARRKEHLQRLIDLVRQDIEVLKKSNLTDYFKNEIESVMNSEVGQQVCKDVNEGMRLRYRDWLKIKEQEHQTLAKASYNALQKAIKKYEKLEEQKKKLKEEQKEEREKKIELDKKENKIITENNMLESYFGSKYEEYAKKESEKKNEKINSGNVILKTKKMNFLLDLRTRTRDEIFIEEQESSKAFKAICTLKKQVKANVFWDKYDKTINTIYTNFSSACMKPALIKRWLDAAQESVLMQTQGIHASVRKDIQEFTKYSKNPLKKVTTKNSEDLTVLWKVRQYGDSVDLSRFEKKDKEKKEYWISKYLF